MVAACGDTKEASGTVAGADSTTPVRDTVVSEGEVALADSAKVPDAGVWLTDANVLALLHAINARQIAAADIELRGWFSESVRSFAAAMAREHAAIAYSIDSAAARSKLAPVAPALAEPIVMELETQLDSIRGLAGGRLDRAYVRHQVASHEKMASYVAQLAAVAEAPAVQGLLAGVATRVESQLTRAKGLAGAMASADSLAAADSAAKAQARRKRQTRGQ